MEKLTVSKFDTHGIQTGDIITVNGVRKPWYKRLFHFLTFGIFDRQIKYTVTSVNSNTELSIEEE